MSAVGPIIFIMVLLSISALVIGLYFSGIIKFPGQECEPTDEEITTADGEGPSGTANTFIVNDFFECVANTCTDGYTPDEFGICLADEVEDLSGVSCDTYTGTDTDFSNVAGYQTDSLGDCTTVICETGFTRTGGVCVEDEEEIEEEIEEETEEECKISEVDGATVEAAGGVTNVYAFYKNEETGLCTDFVCDETNGYFLDLTTSMCVNPADVAQNYDPSVMIGSTCLETDAKAYLIPGYGTSSPDDTNLRNILGLDYDDQADLDVNWETFTSRVTSGFTIGSSGNCDTYECSDYDPGFSTTFINCGTRQGSSCTQEDYVRDSTQTIDTASIPANSSFSIDGSGLCTVMTCGDSDDGTPLYPQVNPDESDVFGCYPDFEFSLDSGVLSALSQLLAGATDLVETEVNGETIIEGRDIEINSEGQIVRSNVYDFTSNDNAYSCIFSVVERIRRGLDNKYNFIKDQYDTLTSGSLRYSIDEMTNAFAKNQNIIPKEDNLNSQNLDDYSLDYGLNYRNGTLNFQSYILFVKYVLIPIIDYRNAIADVTRTSSGNMSDTYSTAKTNIEQYAAGLADGSIDYTIQEYAIQQTRDAVDYYEDVLSTLDLVVSGLKNKYHQYYFNYLKGCVIMFGEEYIQYSTLTGADYTSGGTNLFLDSYERYIETYSDGPNNTITDDTRVPWDYDSTEYDPNGTNRTMSIICYIKLGISNGINLLHLYGRILFPTLLKYDDAHEDIIDAFNTYAYQEGYLCFFTGLPDLTTSSAYIILNDVTATDTSTELLNPSTVDIKNDNMMFIKDFRRPHDNIPSLAVMKQNASGITVYIIDKDQDNQFDGTEVYDIQSGDYQDELDTVRNNSKMVVYTDGTSNDVGVTSYDYDTPILLSDGGINPGTIVIKIDTTADPPSGGGTPSGTPSGGGGTPAGGGGGTPTGGGTQADIAGEAARTTTRSKLNQIYGSESAFDSIKNTLSNTARTTARALVNSGSQAPAAAAAAVTQIMIYLNRTLQFTKNAAGEAAAAAGGNQLAVDTAKYAAQLAFNAAQN